MSESGHMDDMGEMRALLAQTATRIFGDHAEGARRQAWPDGLWNELHQAGFDRAVVPEAGGGGGLSWSDAFSLLAVAGAHAAPVPLAEAMIAGWLLHRAGIDYQGYVAVAAPAAVEALKLQRSGSGWKLSGTAPRVPWARHAARIVIVCNAAGATGGAQLALVDVRGAGVEMAEGVNLAKEPRDSLIFDGATPDAVVPAPIGPRALLAIAAIARSALMAGAIGRVLELAVDYANLRVQFGRPIGKFQVIQQNLAVLATEAVAARAASDAGSEAIDAWSSGGGEAIEDTLAAASAKIRAGEAAGRAAGIAHQVFGAMGFTEEHALHHFTKRLWSWRDEHGNEAFWSKRLGERVVAAGPRALWPLVTDSFGAAADGGARATA